MVKSSGQETEKLTSNTPSPPAVRFTTLISVTKVNGQNLQVEVFEDYDNVVERTTGARGGSHWSWKGVYPGTPNRRTMIVKIDEVSDIAILPWRELNATS